MEIDYTSNIPSGFIEMCRACMRKDMDLKPLFIDFKVSNPSLHEMFLQVTGLSISEDDGLPSHICNMCISLAESALQFKQLCYQSDANFRKSLTGESVNLKPFIKQEFNSYSNLETSLSKNLNNIGENLEESSKEDAAKDEETVKEPYQCGYCCDGFRECNKLKEHVKASHRDKLDSKLKYSCTVCSKTFQSKKSQNSHHKKCLAKYEKKVKVKQEVVSDSDSDTPLSEKVNNLQQSNANTTCPVKSDLPESTFPENNSSEFYHEEDVCDSFYDNDADEPSFLYDSVKTETEPLENKQSEESKYSCDECNLTLTKEMYEAHVIAVHSEKKKKKRSTKKKFSKTATMNGSSIDLKLHDSPVPVKASPKIKCIYCERKFLKESSLKTHIKRHEKKFDEVHKCDTCNREFKRRAHLENHMLSHSIDKGFKCTECPRTFSRQDSLNIHIANNHNKGAKKHQCTHCEKSFSMLSTLKDHIRTHTGEKPFLCSICGRGFSQSTNLKEHMRRHQGYKPFKCNFCSQTFVSKGELEAHFRKHSGAHPFVCDECGGGFTTSSSLVKHKRIHSGERPYKCDFCPMKFTALGTMKNHRRTHTGEKPYKCQYCDKAFVQKNDLVTHTRTHTGERPYVCTVCGHAFRQSSALKTHFKIHGGQIEQLSLNVGPIRQGEQVDLISRPMAEESSSSINMMTPKSENSNL